MFTRRLLMHAMAAAIGIALTGAAALAQPNPPPFDHYHIYKTGNPVTLGLPVTLTDQFGKDLVHVLSLDWFGLPVDKNGEGFVDTTIHYSWWSIQQEAEPARTILVHNQFGQDQQWTVFDAAFLLTPALKFPHAGAVVPPYNHFKCYFADGPPANRDVSLLDQFGIRTGLVDHGRMFCNPTEKVLTDGTVYPILDPVVHLACYDLLPSFAYDLPITMLDQFTQGPNLLIHDRWLCVPSLKEEPTQAEASTWGRLKVLYR